MSINHLDVAAPAVVEHQRRLQGAQRARLLNEAERLAQPRRRRWAFALRLSRRNRVRGARGAAVTQPNLPVLAR